MPIGARSGEEVTLPRTWLQPMRLPLHGDVIQSGESQMTETVVGQCGRPVFSLGRILMPLKNVTGRASEMAQWAKHLPQKSNVLRSVGGRDQSVDPTEKAEGENQPYKVAL